LKLLIVKDLFIFYNYEHFAFAEFQMLCILKPEHATKVKKDDKTRPARHSGKDARPPILPTAIRLHKILIFNIQKLKRFGVPACLTAVRVSELVSNN